MDYTSLYIADIDQAYLNGYMSQIGSGRTRGYPNGLSVGWVMADGYLIGGGAHWVGLLLAYKEDRLIVDSGLAN